MNDWPILHGVPADLLSNDRDPVDGALFFDTSAIRTGDRFVQFARRCGGGLISSLVFVEMLNRRPDARHFANTTDYLRAAKVRVVPLDVEVAETHWRLKKELQLNLPPLCRPGETDRMTYRRLALDLLIFATSLRHRRRLVTENKNDFELFGKRSAWMTLEEAAALSDNELIGK